MSSLVLTTALAFTLSSGTVQHQQCNFQLQHDLTLSPQQLTLSSAGTELWRIDQDGNFWLQQEAQQTT
ncbi:MAG: hypothetical protein JJU30_14485, partial [Alkalimonas sp.]|nr:hypothetical protein [Alkalimonas sp.]